MKFTLVSILEQFWQLIAGGFSTFLVWWMNKPKSKAEIETIQIANVKAITQVYEDALEDLKKFTDGRISGLEKIVRKQTIEIQDLSARLEQCMRQNGKS